MFFFNFTNAQVKNACSSAIVIGSSASQVSIVKSNRCACMRGLDRVELCEVRADRPKEE